MKINYKDILFVCILVLFITVSVSAATYLYNGDEISYDNTNSHLTSTNVQAALDELYTKCNNSRTNLPNNHTCTQKTNIKCKRATNLHTEICTNNRDTLHYYCIGAGGYSLNDTIIYGNSTTIEGVLNAGDAFDCDVNGDGIFDFETERFYYVSDYFDTDRRIFNDKIAVLVYYSNTIGGVANSSVKIPYASLADTQAIGTCTNTRGCNNYGPITAIKELPTTTQWSNIRLYKETRQILDSYYVTTSGGIVLSNFSYNGYAARLATFQELHHGCFNFSGSSINAYNCIFLFENTSYADLNKSIDGSWLENVSCTDSTSGSAWSGMFESITSGGDVADEYRNGVRPVIEVPKSQILY